MMSKNQLTVDELIAGCAIAAKLIIEESDLDESAIDIALTAAYAEGVSAEEWEVRTRKLLGLNPYWHDKEEGGPDARR